MFELIDMTPVDVDAYPKDRNGKINPFRIDPYCMGQQISKDVYRMYDNHNTEPFRYCYLINVRTGERQQLKLKE